MLKNLLSLLWEYINGCFIKIQWDDYLVKYFSILGRNVIVIFVYDAVWFLLSCK